MMPLHTETSGGDQHHHQCVLSLVAAAVSVLPLLCQQHPFPSPSPEQPCLRFSRELWPARASSLPAAHLVYLDPLQQLRRHQQQLFWQQLQRNRHDDRFSSSCKHASSVGCTLDLNWWLLFLSTAVILFASRACQRNTPPSTMTLMCTYR